MAEWITSLEGTEAGHRAALFLALLAALLHAIFGVLQKGRYDPWVSRGAIDAGIIVITLPVALFLVPWPQGWEWGLLLGALVIHFFYKVGVAAAYDRGAFTVVYPVIRGTGPFFTVIGAFIIFGETFTVTQWLGVGLLLAGLYGLALYNLVHVSVARETLVPALLLAVATGAMVAIYTTYDAYGIRAVANPFTFLAWFFVMSALDFPLIAAYGLWRMEARPPLLPLARLGLLGAVTAWGSFGSVMLATRLDKVGEAAVLRETSVLFAAALGWVFLREPLGPRRLALMGLIALGAVVVEAGG